MARKWAPSSTLELSGATMFDSIFFLGMVRNRVASTPKNLHTALCVGPLSHPAAKRSAD